MVKIHILTKTGWNHHLDNMYTSSMDSPTCWSGGQCTDRLLLWLGRHTSSIAWTPVKVVEEVEDDSWRTTCHQVVQFIHEVCCKVFWRLFALSWETVPTWLDHVHVDLIFLDRLFLLDQVFGFRSSASSTSQNVVGYMLWSQLEGDTFTTSLHFLDYRVPSYFRGAFWYHLIP